MDAHLVTLDRDHPGFRDKSYRVRRDAIATLFVAPSEAAMLDGLRRWLEAR